MKYCQHLQWQAEQLQERLDEYDACSMDLLDEIMDQLAEGSEKKDLQALALALGQYDYDTAQQQLQQLLEQLAT